MVIKVQSDAASRVRASWLARTRRIVQLVSLPVSFLLCGFLVLADMPQIIAVILLAALLSSLIVGRAFCSWVCPLGTLYEFVHRRWFRGRPRPLCRIGCPFSLFMGLMNRLSLLKVRKHDDRCIHCGACDASCPVGLVELGSGYQDYQNNPSQCYACIRCLNCVSSCPEGALEFKVTIALSLHKQTGDT
jgi:polyferredoxin